MFHFIMRLKMLAFDDPTIGIGATACTIWGTEIIHHHWKKSNPQHRATLTSIASVASWSLNVETSSPRDWTADHSVGVLLPHKQTRVHTHTTPSYLSPLQTRHTTIPDTRRPHWHPQATRAFWLVTVAQMFSALNVSAAARVGGGRRDLVGMVVEWGGGWKRKETSEEKVMDKIRKRREQDEAKWPTLRDTHTQTHTDLLNIATADFGSPCNSKRQ